MLLKLIMVMLSVLDFPACSLAKYASVKLFYIEETVSYAT